MSDTDLLLIHVRHHISFYADVLLMLPVDFIKTARFGGFYFLDFPHILRFLSIGKNKKIMKLTKII